MSEDSFWFLVRGCGAVVLLMLTVIIVGDTLPTITKTLRSLFGKAPK